MDNMIKVVDADGNEDTVEVLDIFEVEGYDDKEYILYTKNKEVENDNIEVFVSILKQENEEFKLLQIEDEKEWETVERALNEMRDLNE